MKRPSFTIGPIVHPTLLALFAYVLLVRIASLQFLVSLRFPTIDGPPVDRSPALALAAALTAINVGFALLLGHLAWEARRAPAGLRRAHVWGALVGLVVVGVLQFSVFRAMGIFDLVVDRSGR